LTNPASKGVNVSADVAFEDEAMLLHGLQSGDPAAFRRLVELNSANIYGVALKLVGNEQEAEDVLQETFLSAFEAIGRFEGRAKLSTWLYRIAYNASMMRLRERSRMTTFSLDQPPEGADDDGDHVSRELVDWSTLPDDLFLTSEARQEMDRAIEELPESLRSTFVLRDIQGLSSAETAEVLGITVQAVKNRLHRARLHLRERLSGYFGERAERLQAVALERETIDVNRT
jgi:RNA polymerase sigma-70 factor (ECF subfamily)